jgi:outer membrane protein assembly factor BamB
MTEEGLIYVLTREAEILPRISEEIPVLHDFVAVLAPDGTELQKVSLLEAIERSDYSDVLERAVSSLAHPSREIDVRGDILHTNTLEILDGTLAGRLPAFRAGNVLVSMRHTNTIAVLDMNEAKIVWAMSGPWVMQHQPTVLADGNMLLFDNLGAGGLSRVIEFDPGTQEIKWSYDGREYDLYSHTIGSNQRLRNGNTLITDSDHGRAIEVTPSKRIVWEFRTPSRAGDDREFIATLFELERLEPGFPLHWLARRSE